MRSSCQTKSIIKSNKLGGRTSISNLQKQKVQVNQQLRLENVLKQSRVNKMGIKSNFNDEAEPHSAKKSQGKQQGIQELIKRGV